MRKSMIPSDLPHSLEAEMGVLGAVLIDNDAFQRAADKVGAADFFAPVNQKLWTAISEMIQGGRLADGVTLKEMFKHDEDLQTVGGPRYLADLMDSAAFGPETNEYATLIREYGIRRRMIEAADTLKAMAMKGAPGTGGRADVELAAAIEHIQEVQVTVSPDRWLDSRLATVNAVRAVAEGRSQAGIETGITKLDRKIGGMFRGDLIIIAGRPSMGKSALVDQIETNVALRPSPDPAKGSQGPLVDHERKHMVVAKFALEMDRRQLGYRNAARLTHQMTGKIIPYESIRSRRWDEAQYAEMRRAFEQLPHVHWDDTPNIDLAHMRVALTRLKRKYGRLDLVTCDYLQIMEAKRERGQTDAAAIGALTKGMKIIAREFDVPFIALSQLSREVEKREDKRPQLSDLRDSGSIEQDADSVLFVYRDHYYEVRKPEPKDKDKIAEREALLTELEPKMTVINAKQRMGALGDVELFWDARTSWIVSERAELHHGAGVESRSLFGEFA